ncbi:S41 family peptidase [Undibacterium fentianense]|uniref:PDZ domain-containing protein n=1 Tax=Undibacterium fentianense TaxID=2828728 RepID=A0A941IFC6_9BURK|nr:S41 family peptidase [Undibacterium fentianense]MBR7800237.1 PDZ domain-containing protein [Undibacterium fentianense]
MSQFISRYARILASLTFVIGLTSCGGGGQSNTNMNLCNNGIGVCSIGNNGGTSNNNGNSGSSTEIGSPSTYANICTPSVEKNWVRAHLNDVYLWYRLIVDVPAPNYSTPQSYFDALLVKSKDRFSFTASKDEIDGYFEAGEDVSFGYKLVNQNNKLRVTYVQPGSPADLQQIKRGAQIVGLNGTAIELVSYENQIAALYPSSSQTSTRFEIKDLGSNTTRMVEMRATTVITQPVLQNKILTTTDNRRLGYVVFTDHIATASEPLIESFRNFKEQGIDDLVLDLRYNGGGYIYIANEVASMIAGSKAQGKVFEQLQYNDKHADWTANSKFLFTNTARSGQALPQLNLSRVFVLTSARTCSASESIINGLSPFVQVITIGGTTCGKPYGFTQADNCGTAYFAIEFDGINNAGNGGYVNGFAPTCPAIDDLDHELGSLSERLLANAASYSKSGTCGPTGFTPPPMLGAGISTITDYDPKAWRHNRIKK